MKVLVHYRTANRWDWKKVVFEFETLPRQGDYLALVDAVSWHQVEIVVHSVQDLEQGCRTAIYAVGSEISITYTGDVETASSH